MLGRKMKQKRAQIAGEGYPANGDFVILNTVIMESSLRRQYLSKGDNEGPEAEVCLVVCYTQKEASVAGVA